MKKIIKISITIIISMILMVLSMNKISFATNYDPNFIPNKSKINLGDTFRFNRSGYDSDSLRTRLFCIEPGEGQVEKDNEYGHYQVINKIIISGDVAEGYQYKAVKDGDKIKTFKDVKTVKFGNNGGAKGENRKLAAAIYFAKETGKFSNIRYAVWHYMYNWVQSTKEKFTGIDKTLVNPGYTPIDSKIVSAVNDYVKNGAKGKEATATFVSGKNKKSADDFIYNKKKYTCIGSFKAKFSPKLDSMIIEGYKKDSTTAEKVKSFKILQGSTVIDSKDIDKLKSNKAFYILIPKSKKIEKIASIKIKTEQPEEYLKNIKATMFFLNTTIKGETRLQNFSIIDVEPEMSTPEAKEAEWTPTPPPDEPTPPSDDFSLRIVKASEDTLQPIEGAKFDLYRLRPYTVTYNKQKIEVYTGNITVKWTGKRPANTREDDYSWLSNAGIISDKREDFLKMKKIVLDENQYKKLKNYVEVISVTEEKEYTGTYFSDKTENVKRKEVTTILDDETINKIKFREYGEPIKYENTRELLTDSNIAEYPDDKFYTDNIDNQDVIKPFIDGEKATIITDSTGKASYTIQGNIIGRLLVKESDTSNGSGTLENQQKIHNGLAKVYKMVERTSNIVQYSPNKEFGSITITKVDTTTKNEDDYASEDEMLKDSPRLEGVKFKVYYYDENEVKHYLADDFSTPRHTASTSIKDYLETHGEEILADDESDWYICQLGTIDEITKTINNNGDSRDNFTTDESAAHEFVTDKDGIINIPYLPAGQIYYAYESGFDNEELRDWFILSDEQYDFDLRDTKNAQTKYVETQRYIGNEQALTAISGRIWEDIPGRDKIQKRNNLYDDGIENKDKDGNDIDYSGVTVKLVNRGTEDVVKDYYGNDCITTTNEYGEYRFGRILIESLTQYAVMFEYNGLKYTNVVMNANDDNGSKAEELSREEFNKQYSTIEKDVSKNSDNNVANNLKYNYNGHKATLVDDLKYPADSNGLVTPQGDNSGIGIKADTVKIDLYNYLKVPEGNKYKEVRNINLGVYAREQPDIAVLKDLDQLKLSINGYEHIYKYGNRNENAGDFTETEIVYDESIGDWIERQVEEFNVGVRFKEEDGIYSAPVYKEDYKFETDDESRLLQAELTYEVIISNLSTSLQTQINSILDYYDTRYNLLNITNEEGEPIADLDFGNIGYDNQYNRIQVNINQDKFGGKLTAQQSRKIYMTFKLTNQALVDILSEKGAGEIGPVNELLDNMVEINSYSTFDVNGNIYAGIDKNSNPGNADPYKRDNWENDTSRAPSLQLEVVNAREMKGTVFFDNSSVDPNGERSGDGKYTNGESTIDGVTVTLREKSGIVEDQTCDTVNGEFHFEGFIPGEYEVIYTWGGQTVKVDNIEKTINVQDYKATVYNYSRYGNYAEDASEETKLWANGLGVTENATRSAMDETAKDRYSDAIDDYNQRIEIDKELTYIDNKQNINTDKTIKEMNSTTPTLSIPIEFKDIRGTDEGISTIYNLQKKIQTTVTGDALKYGIYDVDFGIVERANQDIKVNKRVSSIKITLANGEVISDVTIDENGKKTGETKYLTSIQGTGNGDGFVKAELDSEVMQNAKLEVGYTIKILNNSEVDYANKEYYTFGDRGKTDIIQIRPAGMIDYLDEGWDFIKDINTDENEKAIWNKVNLDDLKNYTQRKDILLDSNVDNLTDVEKDITKRVIVYSNYLEDFGIAPQTSKTIDLNVSKLLSASADIDLRNEVEAVKLISGPLDTTEIPAGFPEDTSNLGITKHTGRQIKEITPGNYIPGTNEHENDSSSAEPVIVTPNTGEDRNYVMPIAIGLVALITLGAGVILIKKLVVDRNN